VRSPGEDALEQIHEKLWPVFAFRLPVLVSQSDDPPRPAGAEARRYSENRPFFLRLLSLFAATVFVLPQSARFGNGGSKTAPYWGACGFSEIKKSPGACATGLGSLGRLPWADRRGFGLR
jgi:hypothetical protein